MIRDTYEGLLEKAVGDRLADTSWDLRIASAVAAKKRTRTRRLALSSAASLCLAASIVIALALGPGSRSEQVYEPFIARQLAGTHEAVFPASGAASDNGARPVEIAFDSGVDAVIDTALALR